MRQVVAAVFLVSVVLCAGTMAAVEWIVWILLRLGWELLRWLISLWLGVSLPPFVVFEPPDLTVVAVTIDAPMVYDERWDQPLPEPPLPTLGPPEPPDPSELPAPPEPPAPDEMANEIRLAVLEDSVATTGLLMLIGSSGSESAAIADLWSDDEGLANLESAFGAMDSSLSGGLIGVSGGVVGGLGSGGDLAGLGVAEPRREARVIRLAEPEWPADAVGSCVVSVAVDERGNGTIDGWLDCDAVLHDPIADAVRRSTFRPAVVGGAKVEGVVEVVFRART